MIDKTAPSHDVLLHTLETVVEKFAKARSDLFKLARGVLLQDLSDGWCCSTSGVTIAPPKNYSRSVVAFSEETANRYFFVCLLLPILKNNVLAWQRQINHSLRLLLPPFLDGGVIGRWQGLSSRTAAVLTTKTKKLFGDLTRAIDRRVHLLDAFVHALRDWSLIAQHAWWSSANHDRV